MTRDMCEASIFYKPSRASAEAAGKSFAELGYTWRGAMCAWDAFRALSRDVSALRAAIREAQWREDIDRYAAGLVGPYPRSTRRAR